LKKMNDMLQNESTSGAVPGGEVNSAEASRARAAMLIVFLVVFIDLLGFGIMLPLLPRFGQQYLGQLLPGGADSPESGPILGLLMASFSAMQFVFAPFWGRISDSRGRRPILLLGLSGSVIFYCLLGIAWELNPERFALLAVVLMFIARIGAGIAGATISTAQAAIADTTTLEKRKVGMALIGAAFGIGFTFGPLLGAGALTFFPEHAGALGFVAAALSMTALILGIRIMPETRFLAPDAHMKKVEWDANGNLVDEGLTPKPAATGAPVLRRKLFDFDALRAALKMPTVGLLIATFFLATFGFAQFESTLSLLNIDNLRLTDVQNFFVFAFVGFTLMLVQGVLYRRLARRLREETFMTIGMLLMGLGVACLGAVTWTAGQANAARLQELKEEGGERFESIKDEKGNIDPKKAPKVEGAEYVRLLLATLGALAIAVAGFAFLTPSVSSLISRRSDPSQQGGILGVNQSASAMARILGPIVGLILYKITSSHLLPYVEGAIVILIMLPLVPRIRRGADALNVTPA
jgi:MFS family permease